MLLRAWPKFGIRLKWLRRTITTASELQDAKPFSEIPEVPAVPILYAGWNYLPLIGSYKFSALHRAAEEKHKKYGKIVKESLNKDIKVVHLFDIEDFQKVYRNEGRYPYRRSFQSIQDYRRKRPHIYSDIGILISNGEEWYDVRSQVQPHMMKPKAIHCYLSTMDKIAKDLVDRTVLLRERNGGEVKDYINELYKWALESVGLVALDARLGCLSLNPEKEAMDMIKMVNEILTQLMKLEFSPLLLWKYFSTPLLRRFTKNMDDFSEIVSKYMSLAQKRLETYPEDHDATFLEMLLRTCSDPKHVSTMMKDMFMAGIDTTSTTVGFVLYHLARNPDIQEKAHREVKTILQGKDITVDTLNDAKYLKACVKESMRISPVAIATLRMLPQDTVLSGYVIPAGSMVVNQLYMAGRLESNFSDPLIYRPERFLRENITHDPFAFLPFGFGPRSCIGRRIAEQEIWSVLIRLLERFRVEYHGGEIDLQTRLISTPDRPLDFIFYDR